MEIFKKKISVFLLACVLSTVVFLQDNVKTVRASTELALTLSGTYVGDDANPRSIAGLGFQPDVVIIKSSDGLIPAVMRTSTMTGGLDISTNSGFVANSITSLDDNGFTVNSAENQSGVNYHWTAYKAAPGELKVGFYTGNGAADHAITGVGFQPSFVIVLPRVGVTSPKNRSSTMTWAHSFLAEAQVNNRIETLDDPDGFTVGTNAATNTNLALYDYVAWKTIPGRMGTGSYLGDAIDGREITGLGFQPESVWIFPESAANAPQWRTASLAGDNTLPFNNNVAAGDRIQALSADGFQVGTSSRVNGNGITYHWIAWAQVTAPIISTDSLENFGGAIGAFYTQTLTASSGSGGYNNWLITAGNLPDDINLNPNTGVISGTPTVAGTFNFTVQVEDSNQVISRSVNGQIVINEGLAITTEQLPDGEIGVAYSQTLVAVGGMEPYSDWIVSNGSLPDGLDLDPDTGEIFGTPTTSEIAVFSVTVTDNNATVSDPVELSLTIQPAPSITAITFPDGIVGADYIKTLTATAGSGVYSTWTLASGSFPDGLNLNQNTGAISGTPTVTGVSNFEIIVTDSNGISSSPESFSITINVPQSYALSGVYIGDCDQDDLSACSGSRSITGLGFEPDLVTIKAAETTARGVMRTSTMVGDNSILPGDQFNLGLQPNLIKSFDADGFSVGTAANVNERDVTYYWTAFQAIPGELEMGTYNGTGVARSINGIGFAPDLVFVIPESGAMPVFRSKQEQWSHIFFSELGQPANRITSLDEDGFSLGTENTVNANGITYHFVVFKKIAGVFNTDQYSGNDVNEREITGVGFPPEDVWIQGEGDYRIVLHSASIVGDNTLVFAPFAQAANYILSLLPDGFEIGTDNRVNKTNFTYTWFAWAKRLSITAPAAPVMGGSGSGNHGPAIIKGGGDLIPTSSNDLHRTKNPIIDPKVNQQNIVDAKISAEPSFLDTYGHWAEKEIDVLMKDCGVRGYKDQNENLLYVFKPDNYITRGEFITMLIRCKYGVQPQPKKSPFPLDVPLYHWATPYIYKAQQVGIVQGFRDGTFGLNKNVTTAEALKMILSLWVKTADINRAPFGNTACKDVQLKSWYAKYYYFAEKNGINDGFPNGSGKLGKQCSPNAYVTRAAVAKIIVRSKGS